MIDDWLTGAGWRATESANVAGVVASLTFCASYVALAVWTGRMYHNLFALGVDDLRFSPGWGVGAWFVPFLNLVRPKQIVDDLWRASDPQAAPSTWRNRPVSGIVHGWWALLLTGFFADPGDAETIDRTGAVVWIIGACCMVVASGFSWWVTSQLTERGESFAARRGQLLDSSANPTDPTRGRLGKWAPLFVSGFSVVGFGAGAVISSGVAPELEVSASIDARETHVLDLETGDCIGEPPTVSTATLTIPEGAVNTLDVVPCDLPHVYELIDAVEHRAPSGIDFPGQDEVFRYGADRCAEHFEEIVGTPFLQSELDVRLIVPTEGSWRLGDREIHCLAFRVDGAPLLGTVVGSGL
jgi:hypothetical protein